MIGQHAGWTVIEFSQETKTKVLTVDRTIRKVHSVLLASAQFIFIRRGNVSS